MKKVFCLFISIMFIIVGNNKVLGEEISLASNAKSAILLEASTGEIIFEKNSHEKLHPASMTKMMSMLLILENIDKGVIKWDDIVTVSSNASSMGGSQILLETNEQMSVYDLFKGISVASGNDAVVAMAEKIAGTEEIFVEMMNKRANELGLTDTNFKNCHGLDDANHYSSAADMAKIARELVKHEKLFEFTSIYEDYLREGTDRKFWLVNTNKVVFKFYYNFVGSNQWFLFKFYYNAYFLIYYLYFIERWGVIMKENVISRNVQLEIMKFFLKTSVPRIMESNIKPV